MQILPNSGGVNAIGVAIAAAPAAAQAAGNTTVAAAELPAVAVNGSAPSQFKTDITSSIKTLGALLDTPRSITVIPQELIQSTASTSLTEALRSVPGIAQLNVMNLADKVYYNQAYPAHYASIAPGRAAIFNANLRR